MGISTNQQRIYFFCRVSKIGNVFIYILGATGHMQMSNLISGETWCKMWPVMANQSGTLVESKW